MEQLLENQSVIQEEMDRLKKPIDRQEIEIQTEEQ